MSILHSDTEFTVPLHLPETTVRTRTGIVIGRQYIRPAQWDGSADAERWQSLMLAKPKPRSAWRGIATAITLGAALAATLFLTLSNR